MPEHLVTFPPGTSAKLIEEGRMVVNATPRIEIPLKAEFKGIEKAKELFKEDFLGEEAIHAFEEKCRARGIRVAFEVPTEFQYSEDDLSQAKEDEEKDKARMVVLRPSWMTVKEGGKDIQKPVTILNLRDLFKKETKRLGRAANITYDNNPFGEGPVFYKYDPDWYADQDFAREQLQSGYAMPTKEILPGSTNKTWSDQQDLFEPGEKRREAVESVWDSLLYYAARGEKLLQSHWDWTNSLSSAQRRVGVRWASGGLVVGDWGPGDPLPDIGVCSSR